MSLEILGNLDSVESLESLDSLGTLGINVYYSLSSRNLSKSDIFETCKIFSTIKTFKSFKHFKCHRYIRYLYSTPSYVYRVRVVRFQGRVM